MAHNIQVSVYLVIRTEFIAVTVARLVWAVECVCVHVCFVVD
jgi:hypothetical protein